MKTSLLMGMLALFCMLHAGAVHGQIPAEESTADTTVVTFRFVPGQDMFYIPWAGNGAQLEKLYALLDRYRTEITTGRMPVYVDGYCASMATKKENLTTAFVRANRVKSELILQKGLQETDFITANYARAYHNNKDMVVVTLRIPAGEDPDAARMERERRQRAERERLAQAERERTERERAQAEAERTERERAQAERRAREEAERAEQERLAAEQPAVPAKPYCIAVRTNVLYDAMLLPTLGVEWRITRDLGLKLDASRSWWGDQTGKVQKMWLVNPEVRWYLLRDKRFYAGVAANFGQYNLYKQMLGGILSSDTGYQGDLWGAGLTVGYQLCLSRHFSLDFNLGLGYTRFDYDTFRMIDGVRVYKDRNQSKNFWGPTQAGVNLIWTIGKSK